jgi:AraC family transcriptional regulator
MSRARFMLVQSKPSASEVAGRVGYASDAAFNRTFKEQFGASPATFRKHARAVAD